MTTKIGLHSGPASPPSFIERILSPISPTMVILILLSKGLPGAVLSQIKTLNPINWINPFKWRDLILAHGMGPLLKGSDEGWRSVKEQLITGNAQGRVLEVGAGTGLTTAYYDENKVTSLVCLEPFAPLREQLKQTIASRPQPISNNTYILPFGIEEREALKSNKVLPESFDTIVLVQVLCSIPNPHDHLHYLQSLLKPGGKLLLFEHVRNSDALTGFIQDCWTPGWKFISKGCCLNRESAKWVEQIGGWKEVKVLIPEHETLANVLPHHMGIFVKA